MWNCCWSCCQSPNSGKMAQALVGLQQAKV